MESCSTVPERKIMTETISVKSEGAKPAKKKFKLPGAIVIIFGVLIAFILLTWVLDWANVHSTGQVLEEGAIVDKDFYVKAYGILGFGNAIAEGFGNTYDLIFYLLVFGALMEIMIVSGALEAGVGSLIKGLNGKEILIIPLLFIFCSAGGTVHGMQEETIGLFVIIVPALVLAGFDTLTGFLVVVLGSCTGFAMSTVNPFAVGAAEDAIKQTLNGGADSGIGDSIVSVGFIFRLLWWVVLTAVGTVCMTWYAARVHKNNDKSFISAERREEDKQWVSENFKDLDEIETLNKQQSRALLVFVVLFLCMIVFMIPYPELFGYTGVADKTDWPNWAAWLLNGVAQPGSWYFNDLTLLFIIGLFIMIFVLKMPMNQASKACWKGAKSMLTVAILISVAKAIPYVLTTSGMQNWMVGAMTQGLGGMSHIGFLYMMVPIFGVLSLIIPSTSGLAGASLPIISGAAEAVTGGTATAETVSLMAGTMVIYMMMCGLANMFVPTQAVVMAQVETSHLEYPTIFKPVFMYIGVMMLIVLLAIVPSCLLLF